MRCGAWCTVALLGACASDPAWSVLPSGGTGGDGTIAGAPLAVPRLARPPLLDGKLDDAAWAGTAVAGPLVDPGDGRPIPTSPVAASVRLGWDDRALYLGWIVRDAHADSPFARSDEDPHVWARSSGVELMLQPGDPGDNRDYYELQVDAHGAVFDSHFDDYNQPITLPPGAPASARRFGHEEWSAGGERAVFVGRGFWSAEIALPWSALSSPRVPAPPRPGDVWRLNLYSFRDGQREALAWSPLRREGNFHRASRFGRIVFRAP